LIYAQKKILLTENLSML